MTLTQTAIIVKQAIIFSIIALVLGISSFIGYKIYDAYRIAHLPVVEEKPDTKFGMLPQIVFPTSNISPSNFTFLIDTATGRLPKVGVDPGFEKFSKVYFVGQTLASLLSAEKSQVLADKFSITSPPEILSETQYKFTGQNKTLLVNLDNGNFSYIKEATLSASATLDDDNKLLTDFKQFLTNLGYSKDDLNKGRSKIILLKKDLNGKLVPAINRTEAQAAQISLWPADIDKRLIYTADTNKSLVNATVVSGANNLDNYISLDFIYYPIDITTFATYPIKTAETALDDLKNG